VILCPHGCGERLYPDGKHANAEAAELDKHKRECPKLRTAPLHATRQALERPTMFQRSDTDAIRWCMFMAAALNGLHSAVGDGALNFAKRAGEEADAALEEYRARCAPEPQRVPPQARPPQRQDGKPPR
jgi:hypothetical protein